MTDTTAQLPTVEQFEEAMAQLEDAVTLDTTDYERGLGRNVRGVKAAREKLLSLFSALTLSAQRWRLRAETAAVALKVIHDRTTCWMRSGEPGDPASQTCIERGEMPDAMCTPCFALNAATATAPNAVEGGRVQLTPEQLQCVSDFFSYGMTRGNHPDSSGPGPGPMTDWIASGVAQTAWNKVRAALSDADALINQQQQPNGEAD